MEQSEGFIRGEFEVYQPLRLTLNTNYVISNSEGSKVKISFVHLYDHKSRTSRNYIIHKFLCSN